MCGICGILRPDHGPIERFRVEKMRDVMAMRGPDAVGLTAGPGYVFGHRRLAIIDLSPNGNQPMLAADGSVEIVFNGEIYNFQELRSELEHAGCAFRTQTDTEVLIQGYQVWGLERLLQRVRGMFAFAMLDHRTFDIHLARDPVGKKPLFFHWSGEELTFASLAGALALGMLQRPSINIAAIEDILYNLCVGGEHSIFTGVQKVGPGQAVTLTSDCQLRELDYWQPSFFEPEYGVRDEQWVDRIEDTLLTAVRRRLIADVPLGITLSGGIDSGLISALAVKLVGDVQTFTVAIEDQTRNESHHAFKVAKHLRTQHHELLVRSHLREHLLLLISAMGEPLADSSTANLFMLAQLAHQHITVFLAGDGGDELFGGYRDFQAYYLAGRVQHFLPKPVYPLANRAAKYLYNNAHLRLHQIGTVLRFATEPLGQTYGMPGQGMVSQTLLQQLFTPAALAQLNGFDARHQFLNHLSKGSDFAPVDRVMYTHFRTILSNEFLPKADYATMAVGLEARNPFLDRDLIDLATRIPKDIHFKGGQTKILLRKLAYRYLPHDTVKLPKQVFTAPIWLWMADWPDLIDEMVLGPHVESRGWFNRSVLQNIVAEYRQYQTAGSSYLLWSLLILELWLRIHVEGTLKPSDLL